MQALQSQMHSSLSTFFICLFKAVYVYLNFHSNAQAHKRRLGMPIGHRQGHESWVVMCYRLLLLNCRVTLPRVCHYALVAQAGVSWDTAVLPSIINSKSPSPEPGIRSQGSATLLASWQWPDCCQKCGNGMTLHGCRGKDWRFRSPEAGLGCHWRVSGLRDI